MLLVFFLNLIIIPIFFISLSYCECYRSINDETGIWFHIRRNISNIPTKKDRIFYLCKQTHAAELLSDSDEPLHAKVCEYHQCVSYCPVEVFFPWGGTRVILPHLALGCTDIKICLSWWRLQEWLSVHAVTPELHQLTQSDCCHLTAICNFEIFCILHCKSSVHGV